MKEKQKELVNIFFRVWSIESSSLWSIDNPARGQCGVTSLVANDILGGKIYKTKVDGAWHFYNVIDGKRLDFTASQFSTELVYMDILSKREEAMADTNERQYAYLKSKVDECLYKR